MAHDADVVVSCLGIDRPEAREVLEALRLRRPGTPLVVEVPRGENAALRDLPEGCDVIASPVVPEQLVASVQAALARSGA